MPWFSTHIYYAYIIKLIRLRNGIGFRSIRTYVNLAIKIRTRWIQKHIDKGIIKVSEVNNIKNLEEDWCQVDRLLHLKIFLNVFKQLNWVIVLSFFFGMLFKVLTDFQHDYIGGGYNSPEYRQ